MRVEKPGHLSVEQKLIAKEGVHARRVAAVLVKPRLDPVPSAALMVLLASSDMRGEGRDTVRGVGATEARGGDGDSRRRVRYLLTMRRGIAATAFVDEPFGVSGRFREV